MNDKSRRPKKINYKITPELEKEVISIREKTGWGQKDLYFCPHKSLDCEQNSKEKQINNFSRKKKETNKIYSVAKRTSKFTMAN